METLRLSVPKAFERLVSTIPADDSFRPLAGSDCPLVKH
jgi:hypothetical protein